MSYHEYHRIGRGSSRQGKHADSQDFTYVQIDQGPGESGSIDLSQGPGLYLINAAEILMVRQVWETVVWNGLRIWLQFIFRFYQVTEL